MLCKKNLTLELGLISKDLVKYEEWSAISPPGSDWSSILNFPKHVWILNPGSKRQWETWAAYIISQSAQKM